MNKRLAAVLVSVILVVVAFSAIAQTINRPEKAPGAEAIAEAKKMTEGLFADFKNGHSEKMATWIVNEIGYSWDAAKRMTQTGEFRSKLDYISLNPPQSPYGTLDGYDLIDESYLPGTNRYFRLGYMSYHEGAPLIWEFRFYVKPNGKVALTYIAWSEENPFEYLAHSDMLLPLWYKE